MKPAILFLLLIATSQGQTPVRRYLANQAAQAQNAAAINAVIQYDNDKKKAQMIATLHGAIGNSYPAGHWPLPGPEVEADGRWQAVTNNLARLITGYYKNLQEYIVLTNLVATGGATQAEGTRAAVLRGWLGNQTAAIPKLQNQMLAIEGRYRLLKLKYGAH